MPAEKSARELAEMMVGKSLVAPQARKGHIGELRLYVDNASLGTHSHFGTSLRNVSMKVHAGEILGVAGVAGNGQDELLAILSGESRMNSGSIMLDGADITQAAPIKRREAGMLAAPEERLGHAAVPEMSLTENTVMTAQNRAGLARGKWINWPKSRGFADEIIAKFDVRTPGNHVAAASLSGGNLQKFVVGREIMQNPEVIVINQPTWGVDVAAAGFIREQIRVLADKGVAVVVISQDLDELFELADQIAALCEGRLSAAHPVEGLDIQTVGRLMGGDF